VVPNSYSAAAGGGRIAADLDAADRGSESANRRSTIKTGEKLSWNLDDRVVPRQARCGCRRFQMRNPLATVFLFDASSFDS